MDACSVINLLNGGALEAVCSLTNLNVQIGPIVGGECSEECADAIASLHDLGQLEYLTDTPLDSEDFVEFVGEHGLGEGEAECIMLASLKEDAIICCDDMKGRNKAHLILGEGRIIGSIGLLKIAVTDGLLTVDEAYTVYEIMKSAGGFLPDVSKEYFEAS